MVLILGNISKFILMPKLQNTDHRTAIRALYNDVFFEFSLSVKAAPHECVIRTGQP